MVYDKSGNIIGISNTINVANTPAFVGSAVTIFQNNGADKITGVDDGLLNCVSVLKISDSMYYMYYEGFGANGGANYSDISLCFAYSTDGTNFTKGFPSGITPPISDTNLLLPKGSIHGHCVVRVPDDSYQYRMVGVVNISGTVKAKIWKSDDGINWTLIRQISDTKNDSFVSCIVRGNLLKIFLRNRINDVRSIGIITTDLDGNRHDSVYVNEIPSPSATQQYYQASASILDDKRELLLPTIYNPNTSVETVGCLILDGGYCETKTISTSAVIDSNVKSIYFASGLVNIGYKTYAYYSTRNADHDHFVMGTTQSAIKRIEVKVS